MKKILFIVLMLIGLQASSQVILQNVVSEFKGVVNVCADTLTHEDYTCQISQSIDSTEVSPEYALFVDMCNELSGHVTTSFVCQLTVKQTFDKDNPKRVIIRWGMEQTIVSYNVLTVAQKNVWDDFIEKVKSKIVY